MVRFSIIGGVVAALVDLGSVQAQTVTARPAAVEDSADDGVNRRPQIGNPLWAVPIASLSVSRERPLFSPSRRPPPPPPPPVPPTAYVPPVPQLPKPVEPDHPPLSLVGTVTGGTDQIGIFLDLSTQAVIRLRLGQDHFGWTLRAIHNREAEFEKDRRSATLAFPVLGGPVVTRTAGGGRIGAPSPLSASAPSRRAPSGAAAQLPLEEP